MRSWSEHIQSKYVIFLVLSLLAILTPEMPAFAQTVTLTDSAVIGNNSRAGLNLGQPSGSYPFFKNYLAFGNPGFEPMIDQQIYQFQAPQDTSSPTSFRWNVNNTQYSSYDANQWTGATFTVVQGSYASGASDPALGCTGTIKSSTNQSGKGPVFVINPSTNQGSSGCAGNLGAPGQVILVSTNDNMPNVFPTPQSVWQAGANGLLGAPALSGGATVSSETTDLCATCGKQSLLFTVPAGGSATLGTGALLNTASEKTVVLNGAYTVSFWAKSNAAVPPKVTINAVPRAGSACTQTYSGSTSPAITSAWTQYSFTCNFTESATSGGPYPFFINFTVAPATSAATSLEFDNWSFSSNEDTNPTVYSDATVNALQAWCQNVSNTTGPACTLRYGPSPDSEIMSNWVKPQFQHRPSIEQFSAISKAYSTDKTGIHDFLQLCDYVGATPVIIFPVTLSTSDAANLVDYLEGSTSTTYGEIRASLGQATPWVGASGSPFSTIYLEFGNENWNAGFLGHTLGYNISSSSYYQDYALRAKTVFAAARARQSSQGYSQSGTKWVLNAQTAGGGDGGAASVARADVVEINGYTAANINDIATTGCVTSGATNATCKLYGPTLTEPYANTHDPKSLSGFALAVSRVQSETGCGPSGTAKCQLMVYEQNTGTFNASTAGVFNQAVSDSFIQTAFQGVVAADQMGQNDAAGVINQNEYQALQYYFGEGGVNVHMWGTMLDIGGDCSNHNSSLFGGSYCPRPQMLGAQVYNWCKIGPMVQTSWTSNPTYDLPANNNSVNALSGVPVLHSYAFAQGNQRCMVIVNTDVYSSRKVTFTGTNAPTTGITTYQFAPGALNATNEATALVNTSTLETPMANTTTPGVDVRSGYTLPAHSVTAFMWTSNGTTVPTAAATPTFSPAGGSYTSAQTVTLSSSTSGATIYYTTDGTTPTTSSTKYAGPLTVSATEAVKAIAVASGYNNSSVASAAFTITPYTPTATPVLSVSSGTYSSAQTVSITDATAGAVIYYTTNGGTPTSTSAKYSSPISVSASQTIKAVALATGHTTSAMASATYTISSGGCYGCVTPPPTFSIADGTYSSAQTVTISDAVSTAAIYYTTNGAAPTTSSTKYAGPMTVSSSQTIKAMAVASGYTSSAMASAAYVISVVSVPSGPPTVPTGGVFTLNSFAGSSSQLALNGDAKLDGANLQLTDGSLYEDSSVWYASPVNVASFTTDINFQLTSAVGDGFTFAVQSVSPHAIGSGGAGLGYANLPLSVGLKFDLHNNAGEGAESTGLYTKGAVPMGTVGSVSLTSSGIDLHSGNPMTLHLVYKGTTLTMTLTDTVTKKSYTKAFTVNIPTLVGSSTAYVGFTGASGGIGADQEILSWSYSN
jgi:hypothetical protein